MRSGLGISRICRRKLEVNTINMLEDIYSRKIVGYEIREFECGTKAAELLQRSYWREKVVNQPLVLHSDNGAPMNSMGSL
ncbi:MAG: hypothetical protein JKX67_12075 [Colwellia sp.]|nr:hypothetical protein [Colwellia sp.]